MHLSISSYEDNTLVTYSGCPNKVNAYLVSSLIYVI